MNKKILIGGILVVFMLVAISFSTAVSSDTTSNDGEESPLYRIRTRTAIGERLSEIKETIKTKFVGERVFFLPFQWIINSDDDFSRPIRFFTKDCTVRTRCDIQDSNNDLCPCITYCTKLPFTRI